MNHAAGCRGFLRRSTRRGGVAVEHLKICDTGMGPAVSPCLGRQAVGLAVYVDPGGGISPLAGSRAGDISRAAGKHGLGLGNLGDQAITVVGHVGLGDDGAAAVP